MNRRISSAFKKSASWLGLLIWLIAVDTLNVSAQTKTVAELLNESLTLAKQRSDSGDTRTTAAMRLGATFRMAGMKAEAREALEECARLVAKDSNADNRD